MSHEYAVMPKSDYTAACNAIRTKKSTQNLIKSGDMAQEILSIPTGKDEETLYGELLAEEWGTPVATYTLAATLTNITVTSIEVNGVVVSAIPSSVVSSDIVTLYISPDSGYTLPDSITVNGTTVNNGSSYTTTSGCEVMYALSNLNVITLRNFTGNSTVSAVAEADTPTTYTIPAGLYYGKDNFSTLVPQRTSISVSGSCDEQLFDTITIDTIDADEPIPGALVPFIEYRFSDFVPGIAYYDDWTDGYRAITITSDTTVTQAQYEAFFVCYDQVFAFTVQRVGSSSTTYYYSPVGYTWQQFVADSTYNPNGNFTIGDNVVMYTSFPIHWKNTLTPASTIYATDLVSNHSAYYFSISGG